ncbi:MAG TPA: pentapeptide repeat-containing protein, partial [Nannocystis sp.]
GPAGTGKTFLLREVARRISERDATVTPLVVELRGLDRAQDVYELVSGEFARRKQTLPARAFERDLQDGRIVLLFDGFDELAIRVRSAAIPEHFARILGAARGRARVIVASRAEHFVSHRDAVETLMSRSVTHSAGLAGQLQAITQRRLVATRKFTHEDIELYLARSLGSAEAGAARMERFRRVHDLPGLAATPRMLAFLVRLTDEQLDQAAARRDAITSAELYRLVIVDHWLAQQEERFNPPGSAPGPTREALLESATRLALHMWRSTAKSIAATDLDAHTGQQLRRLCEDDSDAARQTLQGRTLLTHGERGQFEFVHQTVMEWLVAQALAIDLREGGTSVDLEHGRLGVFMVDVLRELLGDEAVVAWATRVLTGPVPGNRLAENARIALASMKREVQVQGADLSGQDLRGQSLAGQDLRGALFDGADLRDCDLSGRDLRGASMQGSKLETASLRGADLTGTSLKNAVLLYADLSDANLDGADLSGADLSFARLHRARISDVCLTGAVLLGTSFLGVRGPLPVEVEASVEVGGDRVLKEPSGPSACTVVAGSPQGWVVASGHKSGVVTLWAIGRDKLIRVLRVGEAQVVSLAWSPDCRVLAVAVPRKLMLYRTGGGEPEVRLDANVRSLAFSPDGQRLAGCGEDGRISLWTMADAGPPQKLQGGERIATSVAWSPDGKMLVSGSFDRKLRLWRLDEPGPPIELDGHEGAVVAVAWSPDGTTIASASYDRTVRLWQASDGKLQRVLAGHESAVMGMAWSPIGTAIVTHSAREIRVWGEPWGESRKFATDGALISGVT